MLHDLRLVLWLQMRHARSLLKRMMYFVYADVEEERGFMDRAYQFYAVGFVAVVLVLLWSWVLDTTQGVFTTLGVAGSSVVFSAVLLVPLVLLAGLSFAGLRYSPLKFTSPDLAFLAASPVRSGVLVGVQVAKKVLIAMVVTVLVGYVLGVGFAHGLELVIRPILVSGIAALVVAVAVLGAWMVGIERLVLSRFFARWKVTVGLVVAVLLKVAVLGALSFLVSPQAFFGATGVALAVGCSLALILVEIVMLAVLSSRIDITAVMEENALYAAMQPFGVFSPLDPTVVADYHRRCKLACRGPYFRMPQGEGRRALVARATITLIRQYEGWPALLMQGFAIVPMGVVVLLEVHNILLLLFWLLMVVQYSKGVREVTRAFRDDTRNRLVRDRLPFGHMELLVLDSLPAFALTTLIACVVAPFMAPSVPLWASIALCLLISATMTISCGLDAIRLLPSNSRPYYEKGALALAIITGILSLSGIPELVICGAALVCVVIFHIVRSGAERVL